jgi:hypothetical protein
MNSKNPPPDGPATARELAGHLNPADWREVAAGDAYCGAQARFRVAVDRNASLDVLRLTGVPSDPDADGRRMAEDLLAVIRDELSLADLAALATVFGEALIATGKSRHVAGHMELVFETLESLLDKAAAA